MNGIWNTSIRQAGKSAGSTVSKIQGKGTEFVIRRTRALSNPALANIPILAMTANAFKEDRQADA